MTVKQQSTSNRINTLTLREINDKQPCV